MKDFCVKRHPECYFKEQNGIRGPICLTRLRTIRHEPGDGWGSVISTLGRFTCLVYGCSLTSETGHSSLIGRKVLILFALGLKGVTPDGRGLSEGLVT